MDASALVPVASLYPSSSSTTRANELAARATAFPSYSAPSVTDAYYPSPVFQVDAPSGVLVEVWRDTSTGVETSQSPSKTALLYGQAQGLTARYKTSESGSSSAGSSSTGGSSASSGTTTGDVASTATTISAAPASGDTAGAAVGSTVSLVA